MPILAATPPGYIPGASPGTLSLIRMVKVAFGLLLAIGSAGATEVKCPEVKALVAITGSILAAESWAKAHGYAEEDVKKAKRCFDKKRSGE